jgi:hypothetical protein
MVPAIGCGIFRIGCEPAAVITDPSNRRGLEVKVMVIRGVPMTNGIVDGFLADA